MAQKYDPFVDLAGANFPGFDRLQQELGKVFNLDDVFVHDDSVSSTSQWRPRVDISENDQRYVIEADIPGVDPDSIELSLKQGVLVVSGTRETGAGTAADVADTVVEAAAGEALQYKRVERKAGEFYRRFTLPETADSDRIDASGRHGVLRIEIAKKREDDSRRIKIVS